MFTDLRHAVRLLLNAPGFTLLVVIVLAVGIGATTAAVSFLLMAVVASAASLPARRATRVDPLVALKAD